MSDKVLTFTIKTSGDSAEAIRVIEERLAGLTKAHKELAMWEKRLGPEGRAEMKKTGAEIEILKAKKTELVKETRLHAKEAATEEGTMARLRAETARLRNENEKLNLSTEEGRKKFAANSKQMVENTEKIRDYDRSVSGSKTLVGEYARGFESVGKNMLGMLGASGLLLGAVKKLGEAFMTTTYAIDTMNKIGQASKQIFYDLANAQEINIQKTAAAIDAQNNLNGLRLYSAAIQLQAARDQREINSLRLEESDRTLTVAESLEKLNRIREIDERQTRVVVGALNAELDAIKALIAIRPEDEALKLKAIELAIRIEQEYAKSDMAMKEIETRRTTLMKGETDKRKAMWDAYVNGVLKEQEEEDKKKADLEKKRLDELQKALDVAFNSLQKFDSLFYQQMEAADVDSFVAQMEALATKGLTDQMKVIDTLGKESVQKAEQTNSEIVAGTLKRTDDEIKAAEVAAAKKQAIEDAAFNIAFNATDGFFNYKAARLNASMNEELKAAGDNEAAKQQIMKKYAREEQKLAIKKAFIDMALMALSAGLTKPFVPAGLAAMITAGVTGGFQIAAIKAQKFATGGAVMSGSELPGFSRSGDNTLALVKPGEVILNASQQRSLGGSSTFRKIGVPGFADGGVVGAPVNVNPMDDMMGMARTIINGVNAKDVTLSIHKLREAEKELDTVIQRV